MPLDAGFKAMLTTPAILNRYAKKDKWGNETYMKNEPIQCFVTEQAQRFGTEDGQNKQEGEMVIDMTIITDAYGAQLKDKISVGSTVLYVTAIDTPKDEVGIDLMHTLTCSTKQEG